MPIRDHGVLSDPGDRGYCEAPRFSIHQLPADEVAAIEENERAHIERMRDPKYVARMNGWIARSRLRAEQEAEAWYGGGRFSDPAETGAPGGITEADLPALATAGAK